MRKFIKSHGMFITIGIFLLLWTLVFTKVDIVSLVKNIGQTNGYIIAIIVALVGGLSAFTTASFYTTVAVLVVGGLNPLLLALVVAPFLILGDYIFYYFAEQGRMIIPQRNYKFLYRIEKIVNKKSKIVPSLFIYIYSGLTPLPADILMVLLAISGYKFRYIMPVIFLGHITFIQIVSILAINTSNLI